MVRGSWHTRACVFAGSLFLIILIALSIAAGAAPPSASHHSDIDAEALEALHAYLEARGGSDRLRAIGSLVGEGWLTLAAAPDQPLAFRQEIERPASLRFEVEPSELSPEITATDGRTSWQRESASASAEPLPMAHTRRFVRRAAIEGPLVHAWETGYRIGYGGEVELGDRTAIRLEIRFDNDEIGHYFLDAESYLLLETRELWKIGNDEVEVTYAYADYRPVAGVLFPHRVEQRTTQGAWKVEYGSMVPNSSFDPGHFSMPDTVLARQ